MMISSTRKVALVCAAGFAFGAFADAADSAPNNEAVLQEDETSLVSAEISLDFCSKYLSYGLVDNPDPIMTPGASLTFFDTLSFDMAWIFDTTHWGRKAGYRDRRWRYQELDVGAGLSHAFSADDYDFLPTTVELGVGYMYEYHPRFSKAKSDGVNGNPDSQFVMLEAALPDLWIEPELYLEWDIDRDNGFYGNLSIGHTFTLIGEGDDSTLDMSIRLAQGLGNTKRNLAYLEEDHGGLMDTSVTLGFDYMPFSWLTISPYVSYSDFLFDSRLRDASRQYCENWDESWNFIGGITLTASF